MTSPFATLFLQLQEYIKTSVPAIQWIDQDLGQLENYEIKPSVKFPCVLIDFDAFTYEDMGENGQFAQGDVVLRLAFPPFSNTSSPTPLLWKEKGLAIYDIEYALYTALQGWKPVGYGYMLRDNTNIERREDAIRVRTMRFSISYEDYGASPTYQKAAPSGNVEITGEWLFPTPTITP